jgi:hypothetical protein
VADILEGCCFLFQQFQHIENAFKTWMSCFETIAVRAL